MRVTGPGRAARGRAGGRRLGAARGAAPGEPAGADRRTGGSTSCAAGLATRGAPSHPLSAVQLLPPIPDPEKIVCIGLNYRKHAAEVGVESSLPEMPTIFAKYRTRWWRTGRRCGRRRRRPTSRRRWLSWSGGGPRTWRRARRSITSPATRCSTTSRPATCRGRRRSGCPARSSTARRPAVPIW